MILLKSSVLIYVHVFHFKALYTYLVIG